MNDDRPTAVVTGASSGIGAATARALAAASFRVVLGARRVDRCAAIAAEIDGVAVRLALLASGDGHIVTVTSVAAQEFYDNGAGYTAAKHAQAMLHRTLRGELLGQPVRLTEILPGMVQTDFSLVRFDGDAERADAVYEGITALTATDVADVIAFAATRPSHVNLDQIVLKPRAQAGATRAHRDS